MDKDKEIEEMTKNLEEAVVWEYDNGNGLDYKETATNLYDTGYGNVKQAVKEFAEKLKNFLIACRIENKKLAEEQGLYQLIEDILQLIGERIDNIFKELYGED